MIDLGDPWPSLSVTVTDAAGVAANATAVSLTITLPDGTTTTPAVTNPSVGVYEAVYVPTQAGRHESRWVATGTNASVFTDTLDVDLKASGIVSLAEARDYLRLTTTTRDEEVREVVDTATEELEGLTGPIVRRTLTVTTYPAGGDLFLEPPIISLTTITAAYGYTTTYTVGDYTLDGDAGIVRANQGKTTFAYPVTVTYVAGRVVVESVLRRAAKKLIRAHWADGRAPGTSEPGVVQNEDPGQPFSPLFVARAEVKAMLEDAGLLRAPAVA